MPELPEVEVVRAGLEPAVSGATVASVTVFDARSLRRHPGPPEDFVERLTGRGLRAAVRRGKFLWLPLTSTALDGTDLAGSVGAGVAESLRDSPSSTALVGTDLAGSVCAGVAESLRDSLSSTALVVHLGMSGQVLLRDRRTDDPRTRIRLEIQHPALGPLRLNFVDQRIFGSMAIVDLVPTADGRPGGSGSSAALIPSQVAHIARDPLDPAFDDAGFFVALAKRRTGIKRALLDQRLVSGIGNIYADESLWAARIHFEQPASTLSRARAKTLLAEVRLVLAKALAEGGTSFDAQYVNVNGTSGYFSRSLNVYGQRGRACPRCGRPIMRESFMNRNSHFCSRCQRLR